MRLSSDEQARFLRPPGLRGIEALHATFVVHRYPPHIHDRWTVAHVLRGAARFQLEGHWHLAPAGTVFLIPPGAVHTGEAATPDGYTYRVLYLEPQLLGDQCDVEPSSAARRDPPVVMDAGDLARPLTRMHTTLHQPCSALEQGEALAGVSRRLLEVLGATDPPPHTRPGIHPAVGAARAYIHEHWREDVTLDQLSHAAGLSRFHLLRRFRDQVGMPPSAYRRALRVQAAQRMLRRGAPPAVAALDCGFYDQAHLTRHFKRITGVTPAQYAAAGHGR